MVCHQMEGNEGIKVCVDIWLHPARPSALSGWIMVSGWRDSDAHVFIEVCRALFLRSLRGWEGLELRRGFCGTLNQ